MAQNAPLGPAARHTRSAVTAALMLVCAMLIGVVADQLPGQSLASSPSAAPGATPRAVHHRARGERGQDQTRRTRTPPASSRVPPARGEAGGAVPRGLSVFDRERPAVVNLDPALLEALRQAAADAARDGIILLVNSGWRSPEYQERLLRQAVSRYGSSEGAARWVATAETSSHVFGHAVDVGPSGAMAWLSRHGAEYRLCQIYRNEPWHYELRSEAIDEGCPPMYADPRSDPRMQP
jgi:zinc D-Ala-D-Ala carboxypeptidase